MFKFITSPFQPRVPPRAQSPSARDPFDSAVWSEKLPPGSNTKDVLAAASDPARNVRRAMAWDPVCRSELETQARSLEAAGTYPGGQSKATTEARVRHVPAGRSPMLRPGYIRGVKNAMLVQSRQEAEPRLSCDVLVIGAGPHGSAVAVGTSAKLSTLVADAGPGGSANFNDAEFYLNSANRAERGGLPLVGAGNINQLAGGVQLPDLDGARWPQANGISDAATLNLAGTSAAVRLGARVEKIEARQRPPGVVATLTDGGKIEAQAAVYAPGIGNPTFPRLSDRATKLILEERTAFFEVLAGRRAPGILDAKQAFSLIEQNRRDPLAAFREGTTALVGFGDTARTFVERFGGLGPARPGIPAGPLGTIVWVTGKSGPRTSGEYLESSRARYAEINTLIDEGTVQLRRGRVADLKEVGTPDRRKFRVELGGAFSRSITADRVVFATGNEPTQLDTPGFGEAERLIFEGGERVATQKPGLPLYSVGARVGVETVANNRKAGIQENEVSLFNLGPKTRELAAKLVRELRPSRPQTEASSRRAQPAPLELAVAADGASSPGAVTLAPPGGPTPRLGPTGWAEVHGALLGALEGARVDGSARKLRLNFQKRDGALQLASPSLARPSREALGQRLNQEPELLSMLDTLVSHTPLAQLEVTFPVRDGAIAAPARHTS